MPFDDELQQLQRRCGIMFELSVSLLRVVEIIAREVPQLILNEELNITRLCELLVRVISRTTTGAHLKTNKQTKKKRGHVLTMLEHQ